MQKMVIATCCLLLMAPASATANWFWQSGIDCDPLDQECLLDVALEDMKVLAQDASVNTYGEAFGKLWPFLDEATVQTLLDHYSERPNADDLGTYVNIAIASTPPSSGAVQTLRDLLDDPALAGYLPLQYLGHTLTDAALKADPGATADLAIAKGDVFAQIALDGLYRTIAWMARNDLTRLEAYLRAYNPRPSSYFSPSTHLFQIAAELCDNGLDGKPLADIALADLLRTRITGTERFAIPMRAIVACDGVSEATRSLDDMFLSVTSDIERQKARGADGAFVVQRLVKTVNDDALAPVIRKLHEDGQIAEAETLAERILPQAQVIISINENRDVAIEKSQVQARLVEILDTTDHASSNLDPVTALRWFTTSFTPEDHTNPADYAVFAIDPIFRLWPDPLAQTAAKRALPLLASSKFKIADELRLKTGLALAQSTTCALPKASLEQLLNDIADQESEAVRVIALADYLTYLTRYDEALPACEKL